MKLVLKEYSNPTKETITHGTVNIDFKKGVFTGGDQQLIDRIKDYYEDGLTKDSVRKRLIAFGTNEQDAKELALAEAGYFSEHSQTPSYQLTKPFTDKSEFKALISCMSMYSEELNDIEMPRSTWDDKEGLPDPSIEHLVCY